MTASVGPDTTEMEAVLTAASSTRARQAWREKALREEHGSHGSRLAPLHQPRPRGDQLQSVGEREDTREAGGDQLPHRVAQHGGGGDAPGHEEAGRRVPDHEERGLGVGGAAQDLAGVRGAVHLVDVSQEGAKVEIQAGGRVSAHSSTTIPEHRLLGVEMATRAGPLGALPGEDEDRRSGARRGRPPTPGVAGS